MLIVIHTNDDGRSIAVNPTFVTSVVDKQFDGGYSGKKDEQNRRVWVPGKPYVEVKVAEEYGSYKIVGKTAAEILEILNGG